MRKDILIVFFVLLSCDITFGGQDKGNEKIQVIEKNDVTINKDSEVCYDSDTVSFLKKNELLLYIGTYTDAAGKGIYLSKFDTVLGTISTPKIVAIINNPSFQCIRADKKQLWSVSEAAKGPGQIVGYKINQKNGGLKKMVAYSSKGSAPCYISFDNIAKSVLAANYGSGNVIRLVVNQDGSAVGVMANHQHKGTGPDKSRQNVSHAHSIKVDLSEKYAYSCDLGADKIYVYDLRQSGLDVCKVIKAEPGSGPRHIAFCPGDKAMSIVHELNNTIATYIPDKNGRFTILKSVISALPSSFSGVSNCADIHYSPDGLYLYASNRGDNSIVICKVNQKTMEPKVVGWMKEGVNWPRNFTIDPSGNYLIVANKNGDTITVYKINRKTGLLTYTGNKVAVSKPVCLTLSGLN